MTEWQDFWSSDCGREFVRIMHERLSASIEALEVCENFETYKEKVGYVRCLRDTLVLIDNLKEVSECK